MPFAANSEASSSVYLCTDFDVTKSVSGTFGSASISYTFLNAAMATSSCESSGSRVVSSCSANPGALMGRRILLCDFARSFSTSYEMPAIRGRNRIFTANWMRKFTTSPYTKKLRYVSHTQFTTQ